MISRRSFLTSLLAVITVPVTVNKPRFACGTITNSLMGVPYHQSNASMGTWLGFDRSTHPAFVSWMHPSQKEAYDALVDLVTLKPPDDMYIDNISVPEGY